jgi:hypothetical protein
MKGILGLIAILAAGYVLRAGFRHLMDSVVTDKAATCLEMVGYTTTEEENASYIIGSVRNKCDTGFGQVTVVFKVDATPGPFGDLPETMVSAYSRDVKAGETREFKTAVPKEASCRFDSINAF